MSHRPMSHRSMRLLFQDSITPWITSFIHVRVKFRKIISITFLMTKKILYFIYFLLPNVSKAKEQKRKLFLFLTWRDQRVFQTTSVWATWARWRQLPSDRKGQFQTREERWSPLPGEAPPTGSAGWEWSVEMGRNQIATVGDGVSKKSWNVCVNFLVWVVGGLQCWLNNRKG